MTNAAATSLKESFATVINDNDTQSLLGGFFTGYQTTEYNPAEYTLQAELLKAVIASQPSFKEHYLRHRDYVEDTIIDWTCYKERTTYTTVEDKKAHLEDQFLYSTHHWDRHDFNLKLDELGFTPLHARVLERTTDKRYFTPKDGHVLELRPLTAKEKIGAVVKDVIDGLFKGGICAPFMGGVSYTALTIGANSGSTILLALCAGAAFITGRSAFNFAKSAVHEFKNACLAAKETKLGLLLPSDTANWQKEKLINEQENTVHSKHFPKLMAQSYILRF